MRSSGTRDAGAHNARIWTARNLIDIYPAPALNGTVCFAQMEG